MYPDVRMKTSQETTDNITDSHWCHSLLIHKSLPCLVPFAPIRRLAPLIRDRRLLVSILEIRWCNDLILSNVFWLMSMH